MFVVTGTNVSKGKNVFELLYNLVLVCFVLIGDD